MNPSEAREHLDLVEKIVGTSSRKLEAGGEYFIVWGLAAGLLDLLLQLVSDNKLPVAAMWSASAIYCIAIAFSIVRGRSRRQQHERFSFLQREFFNVLMLTLAMAFAADLVGSHIFSQWGQSAVWNVAASVVLFYIGMHGNRRAVVGGIVMLLSLALANFEMAYAGYALGGGFVLGYAGFGVADLLARE